MLGRRTVDPTSLWFGQSVPTREILVSRKKNGFCAEVVHRGQPYLILENALKPIKTNHHHFCTIWTQKNHLCFIKFDFLPLFCLPGLVPNSRLLDSRGWWTRHAEERERELWHGILFEEPNPEREPPKRPNWALYEMAKGKETPTGEKEQQGRGGGDFYSRGKPSTCV